MYRVVTSDNIVYVDATRVDADGYVASFFKMKKLIAHYTNVMNIEITYDVPEGYSVVSDE